MTLPGPRSPGPNDNGDLGATLICQTRRIVIVTLFSPAGERYKLRREPRHLEEWKRDRGERGGGGAKNMIFSLLDALGATCPWNLIQSPRTMATPVQATLFDDDEARRAQRWRGGSAHNARLLLFSREITRPACNLSRGFAISRTYASFCWLVDLYSRISPSNRVTPASSMSIPMLSRFLKFREEIPLRKERSSRRETLAGMRRAVTANVIGVPRDASSILLPGHPDSTRNRPGSLPRVHEACVETSQVHEDAGRCFPGRSLSFSSLPPHSLSISRALPRP